MNIIANPSMPISELAMPRMVPTGRLTLGVLFAVRAHLKPEGKLTCFMSWGVRDRVLHWNLDTPDMMRNLKDVFNLELDEYPPRYDFINGEWVSREAGTVEWYNSAYEDAMIFEGDAARAVVRFSRIGGQNT